MAALTLAAPWRHEAARIAFFVLAGVINTAFGYGVYALAVWAGLVPSVAVVVSTIAGVAFNFRTIGAVFAARGFARLPHFVGTYALLAPLNVGLLYLAQAMGAGPYLGEAIALAVVVPLTYLAMRLFVFAPPEGSGAGLRAPRLPTLAAIDVVLTRNWAVVAAVVFTLQAVLTLTHRPWLDEWQALMIAVQSPGPSELLANLRYEGHPPLWYVILRAVAAVVGNGFALQATALALATLTQALILFRSPFPRHLRLAIALSEIILFEYNTLARGYTLGIALTFAVLALWKRRGLVWVPLALLPCVDFFFGVFSAIFIVLRSRDRSPWLPGVAVWLALSAACAWTVLPAADTIPAYLPARNAIVAAYRYTFSLSSVALPFAWEGGPRWDGQLVLGLHTVVWVAFVMVCLEQTRGRWLEQCALFGFILLQLAFFILAYPLGSRHVMLTGVLLIAIQWLQAERGIAAGRLYLIWVGVSAALGIVVAAINLTTPFDTGYRAAAIIRERGLEGQRWVSYPTILSPSVTAWSGMPFERLEDGCEQTFVRWNFQPRFDHLDKRAPRAFALGAERAANAHGRFYVLTRYRLPQRPMIHLLDAIPAGYDGFAYRLYEIGPSLPAAPRSARPCVTGLSHWPGIGRAGVTQN